LSQQLGCPTGRADELATASCGHFDVVDQSTDRDIGNRQSITRADFSTRAGHDSVADPEVERRNDVALLAIRVVQKSEAGGAVRVIFDRCHFGGNLTLVALEIYDADKAFVSPTAMANGNTSTGIAAAPFAEFHKRG